jgi:hypothetical protein
MVTRAQLVSEDPIGKSADKYQYKNHTKTI